MKESLCKTCVNPDEKCRGVPVLGCTDYERAADLPLDELTRLKVEHARLTDAYVALREKYREAFPGPVPKPCQCKAVDSYDVAFFPYPPEWDCLQEHISRGDAVVEAARKALAFIEDRRTSVSNAFIEAHNILYDALKEHDR